MSFENLPKNWPTLPLTDPALADDVVDLVVSDEQRANRCIGVLICDDQHRLMVPISIGPFEDDDNTEENWLATTTAIAEVVKGVGRGAILARGRPSGQVCDTDRAWHQRAIEAFAAHGLELIGAYLATHRGVWRLPDPEQSMA
jgi:hypothetical protein